MSRANGSTNGSNTSPVAASEVAAVRQPTQRASLLPGYVYHDQSIFSYEQEAWFADGWVCIGREEDIPLSGQYFLTGLCNENIIVIRGDDGEIRAFYNICRHRGSTLLTEPTGQVPRIQCPYHAWVYSLDGRLKQPRHTELLTDFEVDDFGLVSIATGVWQGFIFVNLTGTAPPLLEYLDDMPSFFERFDLAALRRERQIDYDIKANWKAVVENYSECYHCPGVHPQLNKITPYNMGSYIETDGPWKASWMPVVGPYDTLTMDGQIAEHGRDMLPGMTEDDHKRIYYFIVWPNMLISLHPDYLMTHRIVPLEPGRSFISCEWFFDPEDMRRPEFDATDAIEFWDLTNVQDWEVCELQQRGTASRGYTPGRYTAMEAGVHSFDIHVADRYAADGVITPLQRISKEDASAAQSFRLKTRAR